MRPPNRLPILTVGLILLTLLGCAPVFREPAGPSLTEGCLEFAQVKSNGRVSPYHPDSHLPSPTNPADGGEQARYPEQPHEPELVPPPVVQQETAAVAQPPIPTAAAEAEPPRPEEPLLQALRCLLDRQPEEALLHLKAYEQFNQDMLLSLLALTVRLTQGSLDRAAPQEVSHLLEQLNGLAVLLRPRAALSIEKMCLCRDIRSFGDYDPLPERYEFRAGRDGRPGEWMQLYVELKNFASQPRGSHYETRLDARLEICDRSGKVVWQKDFPAADPDRSQTLRSDYFIAWRIPLDARIVPGYYTLRAEVRDAPARPGDPIPPHRIARRSLDFQVGTSRAHTTARPGN
jgi:hypothetical protein